MLLLSSLSDHLISIPIFPNLEGQRHATKGDTCCHEHFCMFSLKNSRLKLPKYKHALSFQLIFWKLLHTAVRVSEALPMKQEITVPRSVM